jgi:hypothetical protein
MIKPTVNTRIAKLRKERYRIAFNFLSKATGKIVMNMMPTPIKRVMNTLGWYISTELLLSLIGRSSILFSIKMYSIIFQVMHTKIVTLRKQQSMITMAKILATLVPSTLLTRF